MKVNQIASIMNTVFSEIIGDSEPINEDLSNIVDVGRQITSNSLYLDNIDGYSRSIIDKVGLTIFDDKTYRGTAPDIYATDAEFGSILEKIRVTAGEFDENKAWTFTDDDSSTFADMYGYHPIETTAKYFNKKVTFATEPYTMPTGTQLNNAFNSASDLIAYFGHIEIRVQTKMQMALDALIKRTINNLIAEKFKAHHGIVNLFGLYKADNPNTTLTAATCKNNADFLRSSSEYMGIYRAMLREETALFNDDGYYTHTDSETGSPEFKFIMLTDFARALDSHLYGDTFHEEYVKVDGFEEIGYWQSVGTTDNLRNSYKDRSSINVIPASEGAQTATPDTRKIISFDNIIATMFDRRACMVNAKNMRVVAKVNEFDEWTNYKHKMDAGYFVDTGENALVFVLSDYDYAPDVSTAESEPANWSTDYVNYYTYDPTTKTYTQATSTWSAQDYYTAV